MKYTEDLSLVGIYPIDFVISSINAPSVSVRQTNAFSVTVTDPCTSATTLTNTGPLQNQDYTLTDSDKVFTIDLNKFIVTPAWCTISFALGGGALPAGLSSIVTFDAPSRQFTISSASISDLTLSGSS